MVKINYIKKHNKREINRRLFQYNFSMKNRRGWIRLMEVFISILLLAGVLLVVATQSSSNSNKNAIQTQISGEEIAILRDIELNNALRTEIVNVNLNSLPVEWNDFNSGLQNVRDRIAKLTPKNFDCQAKLCLMNEECIPNNLPNVDVYAKSVIISSNLDVYSPRELKLFCMSK
jgi:hypothetical protein